MNNPYVHTLLTGKVKQMGKPDALNRLDRQWESAMFKQCTAEKVWLYKTGLTDDEVADTKNHGGPEKALFLYPTEHYTYWKKELNLNTIGTGSMGENLAVDFMDEHTACIGDIYQFGEAMIQVSQPRRPCWKPARRFRTMDFAIRIQNSGKTGWYFRVIKEGYVQGQADMILLERPYPKWTIAACNDVMYVQKKDLDLAAELVNCTYLAENWKRTLHKRLAGRESSMQKRVYGPNKD